MRLGQKLVGLGVIGASLTLTLWAGAALAQQGPPGGCPPPGGPPPAMGAGGPPPGMPPGGGPPGMPPAGGPPSENDLRATQSMMQSAFDLLGISPDQMMSQAQAGHGLGDIAGAQGIDLNTLAQTMTSGASAWLSGELAAGRLSQSDADSILQRSQRFALQMMAIAPPASGPAGGPPGGPPPNGMGCPPSPGGPLGR